MHTSLSKLQARRAQRLAGEKNDKGFTLIELLVVVVILGVLIAVAIPLYLNYRKGANDSAAQSDLRNAMSVLEVCNTDTSAYPSATFTVTSAAAGAPCTTQKINVSANTSLVYTPKTTGGGYVLYSSNSAGTPKYYCYDSSLGGAIKNQAAAPTTPASGC